jgi:hypothetical protein
MSSVVSVINLTNNKALEPGEESGPIDYRENEPGGSGPWDEPNNQMGINS